MPFTDVKSTAWYYNDVKIACDDGLINGKSETKFDPDANLTYAEAVKLAACMHQKSTTGKITLTNGDPWYQSYVDYCKTNGIISKDYNWNTKATRAGYMEIFANALPDKSLKAVNTVSDGAIPDVDMSHPQSAAIYKLYRAGILQGVDSQNNCNPSASIKRCEVSAILTRMMYENQRLSFSLEVVVEPVELVITKQPKDVSAASDELVKLTVGVTGGKAPYTYQWKLVDIARGGVRNIDNTSDHWTDADGALNVKAGSISDNYALQCVVTDSDGSSVTSNRVKITVTNQLSATLPETMSIVAKEGVSEKITANVTGGSGDYAYKWYAKRSNEKDWILYANRTNTLSVDASKFVKGEKWNIYCSVTDNKSGDITRTNVLEITAC